MIKELIFGSVPKSPTQMGSLSVENASEKFSRFIGHLFRCNRVLNLFGPRRWIFTDLLNPSHDTVPLTAGHPCTAPQLAPGAV